MKKYLYSTLVLIICFMLAACNEKLPESAGPAQRILLWHDWDEAEETVLNNLIAEFVAIHPEATVIRSAIPQDELLEQFEARTSLGLGPDILIGPSDWVRDLADAGLIQDLSNHNDVDTSVYLSSAVDTLRYQDGLYGLPLSLDTLALYYNKRLVDTPPETLDILLRQVEDGKRFALDTRFDAAFWGIQAFGGQLLDGNGRVVLNQGGFANWLGWLKNAQDVPNIILSNDQEMLYTLFQEGEVAYYVGGPEVLTGLQEALDKDAVGVAPLPKGPNGPSGPLLRTEALLFNTMSSPAQTEMALRLAQFLTTSQQQAKLARSEAARIPANTTARVDPVVYPAMVGFIAQSKTAVPVLNLPQINQVQRLGNDAMIQALAGVVDQSEAALQLTEPVNQIYGFETLELNVKATCPTQKTGTVKVWHRWAEPESTALAEIAGNFERFCPNITIELTPFEPNTLYDQYQAAAARRQGPDLLIGPSQWLAPLAADNLIADLSSLIEPELWQQYIPVAQDAMQYQERLYGLPESLQVMALYYKTDRVTDPAREIDNLLIQAGPDQKVALPTTFNQAFGGATAFGSISFDADYRPLLDEDSLVAWLTWLQNAQDNPGVILSDNSPELKAAFMEDDTVYLAGDSSLLGELQTVLGQQQVGVVPLPAGPGGEASPFATAEGVMLNSASIENDTQAALALEFAKFMTNLESQTLLMEQANHIPTQVNVVSTDLPAIAGFLKQTETAVALPNLSAADSLQSLGDTLYRQVLDGTAEPGEAVKEFMETINKIETADPQ